MNATRALGAIVLALLVAASTAGCASSHPPLGRADVEAVGPGGPKPIYNVRTPVGAAFTFVDSGVDGTDMDSGWSRMGKASCHNVLGLLAFGDATVETAARSAGITRIHHVDAASSRFLFIYSQYTTIVYGE
ncbi:MAG TPA: TRL-like family protein [Planctomycetota bacterium]|nr:TRL-like family protein [Planctomycetota bacterium]